MEINLPERTKTHSMEGDLQRALQDPSIALLWNPRRGIWQVASWSPERRYIMPKLHGVKGCVNEGSGVPEHNTRTHWVWVFDCCRLKATTKEDPRPYSPVPPGEWVVQVLKHRSLWTRPDIPNEVQMDPSLFPEWLRKRNEALDREDELADREEWVKDAEKETYNWVKGKKIFLPMRFS